MVAIGPGVAANEPVSITFDLADDDAKAIQQLAGERKIRLSGQIRKGKLVVDSASFAEDGQIFQGAGPAFVAVNAPFLTSARVDK